MRNVVRLSAILVVALGVLTFVAYSALVARTRTWFESDVVLRAQLVVASARQSLAPRWAEGDAERLGEVLGDIARDRRIMAVAACGPHGETKATTEGFPERFACPRLESSLGALGVDLDAASEHDVLSSRADLPGGPVHVAAAPLFEGSRMLGRLVLVHDLSFVSRRDEAARDLLLLSFFVLATAASAVTLIASRLSRRSWTAELRGMLRGEREHHPDYQPLMKDVRALVDRLSGEQEPEPRGGLWTPKRLKATLSQHLRGERIVILANREPYIHEREASGEVKVKHPASGLVTALEPVMRACSGVWIAHGSGSADRECADDKGRVKVPPGEESYVVRRVWMSEAEEEGYYYGFSNEGLWPLCHLADARPVFRAEDFEHYRTINQRFADAVCDEVDSDDPIVLVQDYHFALAPKMIRERLPRATIITFWHIPWTNSERFGICPWREELLDGLLGSSILGFHTQLHCNNFFDAVDAYLEARIDRESHGVVQSGRKTLIRPYPISTEWPVHWLADLPSVEGCRDEVRRELGLPSDTWLGVGVDRLDYTKGIEERLLAVERLLERHPETRGRVVFVQLAAPSRSKIARYKELAESVERTAERINATYGTDTYKPILLMRAHHEPPTVFRYYRAADVCYVSSLHDGMNLVAKEFVAARDDERGVLVLSHFTGAARELTEALIVNPYDLDQASDALFSALSMPAEEQRERMRSMRRLVSEYNVYRWAGRMLVDAAQLRRRERVTGRLSSSRMRTLSTRGDS